LAHFLQVIAINCIRLANSNPYLTSSPHAVVGCVMQL
jgi:hypothetical protein